MVIIRRAKKSDIQGIVHVCYKTGYMGEDATPYFSDEKLFGYLFSQYYPEYETEHCFVAVDNEKVVGYILGSPDSERQGKMFISRIIPRVIFRLFFITSLKYFSTFKHMFKLVAVVIKYIKLPGHMNNMPRDEIDKKFPAHLHINILEEYQRKGIGGRLIKAFETHMKELEVKGIHLGTSEKNFKAIPFYKKIGYKIVRIDRVNIWPNEPDIRSITFAKKI